MAMSLEPGTRCTMDIVPIGSIERRLLKGVLHTRINDRILMLEVEKHCTVNDMIANSPFSLVFKQNKSKHLVIASCLSFDIVGRKIHMNVELLTDIESHPERNYFRIQCNISVLLSKYTAEWSHREKTDTACMLDFSGGGCRLYTDIEFAHGDCVALTFLTTKEITFCGKVVRVEDCEDQAYLFSLGVQYDPEWVSQASDVYKYIITNRCN